MNENEINNQSIEEQPVHVDEENGNPIDVYMGPTQPSSDLYDEEDEKDEVEEGFSFHWAQLLYGIAICLWFSLGDSTFFTNWTFYLYLGAVIIIHELGHVVFGKTFGCHIKEMQVFFFPFVSYKPRKVAGGSSWRDITWSLGVLPLGGATVFRSRELEEEEKRQWYYQEPDTPEEEYTVATSPYIDDKPAWQRLLISAAGVLFNFATFLVLYVIMPFIPVDWYEIVGPLTTLSLILAVLNILPIYPLDGGSIVFALFEILTGKKPSPVFTKICGWIGFIIIVLLFWVFPESLDGILGSVFRTFF